MYRQRQRHFISENADLLADLRTFYNPTGVAFGLLKQKPLLFQKSAVLLRPGLFHQPTYLFIKRDLFIKARLVTQTDQTLTIKQYGNNVRCCMIVGSRGLKLRRVQGGGVAEVKAGGALPSSKLLVGGVQL
jgi:hypothetical protein